jgi:hypothetical protein
VERQEGLGFEEFLNSSRRVRIPTGLSPGIYLVSIKGKNHHSVGKLIYKPDYLPQMLWPIAFTLIH